MEAGHVALSFGEPLLGVLERLSHQLVDLEVGEVKRAIVWLAICEGQKYGSLGLRFGLVGANGYGEAVCVFHCRAGSWVEGGSLPLFVHCRAKVSDGPSVKEEKV